MAAHLAGPAVVLFRKMVPAALAAEVPGRGGSFGLATARVGLTAASAQISFSLENRDPLDLQGTLHGRPFHNPFAQSRPG